MYLYSAAGDKDRALEPALWVGYVHWHDLADRLLGIYGMTRITNLRILSSF